MTDERWNRIEKLFKQAAAMAAEARDAFLAEECGDDQGLRNEVESLLSNDSTGFMEDGVEAGPLGGTVTFNGDTSAGAYSENQTVGSYRILGALGEGGMGFVYMAEQTEPVRRRVALKVIKLGMDSAEVLRRFEAERQALAMMNHRNIARVLDAGTTPTGQPYFSMELVQGVPLTEYCDRHRLSTQERLELFMQVCDGVQHAHQKGIIHRDLKPSNILVGVEGDRPVPKIIDFGVAKATNQRLTERTIFTALGQIIGTPEYMSPEQAEMTAEDIDTRSDIYSLGVLLYELLVGALPFDPTALRNQGYAEVQRIIREVEPSKPSTRVSTLDVSPEDVANRRRTDLGSLRRTLQGDLDWITMRALEKDRTRRYASAAEFAADIQRHLADEPVVASPPSQVYRFKKFCRKNRLAVGAAATVTLAVAVGFVVSLWSLREASIARRETLEAKEALLRLSDLTRLMTYVAEAEDLHPPSGDPDRQLAKWIEKSKALIARLPQHSQELQALDSGATSPNTPDAELRLAALKQLVSGLQEFMGADGTFIEVQERLAQSNKAWAALSNASAAKKWRQAVDSIRNQAECPKYRGLLIERQRELIPLSRNTRTGLWEFWHPATGTRPRSNPNWAPDTPGQCNRWLVDGKTSVVFVLVPGGEFEMGAWRPTLGIGVEEKLGGLSTEIIVEESLAAQAGVRVGDRLMAFNQVPTATKAALADALTSVAPGTRTTFHVQRGQSLVSCSVSIPDSWPTNADWSATPDQKPVHTVALAPFFVSKYELTQAQWRRGPGVTESPSLYPAGKKYGGHLVTEFNPVENVTWPECRQFLERLALTLPTEAQWEYACRGGTTTPFSSGYDLSELATVANIGDIAAGEYVADWGQTQIKDGFVVHAPVGSLRANPFGLHDVHGGVWEWCRDGYADYSEPVNGPDALRSEDSERRVVRGGSFIGAARRATSAHRTANDPDTSRNNLGLRPARPLMRTR